MDNPKIKVLVLDDEEDITHFTAKILEYEGFEPLKALDGAAAIAIFEKERPQICILDVHLGYSKVQGIQVLEKIKTIDKNTECIMITRITDHETVNKAKRLGVKHYLLKPFATEDWLQKVHEIANAIKERNASNG